MGGLDFVSWKWRQSVVAAACVTMPKECRCTVAHVTNTAPLHHWSYVETGKIGIVFLKSWLEEHLRDVSKCMKEFE